MMEGVLHVRHQHTFYYIQLLHFLKKKSGVNVSLSGVRVSLSASFMSS